MTVAVQHDVAGRFPGRGAEVPATAPVPDDIDPGARYALPFGTVVLQRDRDCVQIGTDPPRTLVVRNAPVRAAAILAGLNGLRPAAEVLREHQQPADDPRWTQLLRQLFGAGLLVAVDGHGSVDSPVTVGAHLRGERAELTHRYGHATAARILQARDDALVVVRGGDDLALAVTAHLAAAGIGHLHHDVAPPLPWVRAAPTQERPSRDDRWADLRSRFPALRLHTPAAHHHPTAVVLTGDVVPDLGIAARYSRSGVPHLPVATGPVRVVVGPFVLPGRSACLSCVHRHRTDADPQWPAVAGQMSATPAGTSAALTAAAVCLTVAEVLDHIDGVRPPSTIDGTLEWRAGAAGARRRTWPVHPDCGCRSPLVT
jgi:hypothetical protein